MTDSLRTGRVAGDRKSGRRRRAPARRGDSLVSEARWRVGSVGPRPGRGVVGARARTALAGDRGLTRRGSVSGSVRRERVARTRLVRAAPRRRPAQVFCRSTDGWDVGMSKPSAFTVPPPPHKKVQREGFEPSDPGPFAGQVPPEHRIRGHGEVTPPTRRPTVRPGAAVRGGDPGPPLPHEPVNPRRGGHYYAGVRDPSSAIVRACVVCPGIGHAGWTGREGTSGVGRWSGQVAGGVSGFRT